MCSRPAERAFSALLALALAATAVAAEAQAPPSPPVTLPGPGELRTFELPKPVTTAVPVAAQRAASTAPLAPAASQTLRATIGLGYVQGADWGSEILAAGSFAGAQVQFNSLLTRGREGLLFDHGTLSIFDPDRQLRLEAGDVFSQLRGAAIGGRVSWKAAGNRRPAVAVYAPRRGALARGTVLTYRDGIQLKGQTLLDAEIATDRSYLLRSHLAIPALEIETVYRAQRVPHAARDASISAGVNLWRGVSITGSIYGSRARGERNAWRIVSLRLPLFGVVDLTLERAFAGSRETSQATSAIMGGFSAGDLRLFHRYQHGEYEFAAGGLSGSVERQQVRSVGSYSPGPRLNLALQMATQRTESGQVQHWEELQTMLKLTSTTTLRTVTAVPDVRNLQRLQVYMRQELTNRLALRADYGRISAYQSIPRELDRARLRIMLFGTFDLATPAGGATVSGRVLDHAGRGVAGARVRLGPYTADADAQGAYRFAHVPRGAYELSLERHLLPADYAWDGRGERLTIASSRPTQADLRVTPLNTLHGRVYTDRNANGRFDSGEGVQGAVLSVGERHTATDVDGSYSFYNLWPGGYEVKLQSVPDRFQLHSGTLSVTLSDGAPVTGADFRVLPREKPIIWGAPGR